ncbi:Ohr family peroxiredoxin [Pseudonocardia spirodelae]|uniref:Ohr family peroxiredoxin n=1 Tax=Pseudonocardia spirodelae TaxID=3133431 RepID=A0ABU8T4M9_9PSEU
MANYTTEATSSGGGRDGRIRTDDGFIDQDLKMPPELGGPGGGTNPEQLFAAAYASCFHGALGLAARAARTALPDGSEVTATIQLQPDDVSFHVAADLTAHLPGLEQSAADELVEKAHTMCPYSKATRGNVEVTLTATV